MTTNLEDLQEALIAGDRARALELADAALRDGVPATDLQPLAIVPAMDEVGRRMESGEFYLPQVLVAARAVRAVADRIAPLLVDGRASEVTGTVVIGTVQGDLHDVGKNLVAMMLEGSGFRVVDLGVNVEPERFVAAARAEAAGIVALSALLTTTMGGMREVIGRLTEAGLRDRVAILVGGAPLSPEFAAAIGSDGYARDAAGAVTEARRLVRVAA